MTSDEFKKYLQELNINITKDIEEKLEIYKNFLQEYNKHTNLTTIIEDKDIYLKHFYDSLTITKVIDLNNVDNLLDIGTGAGFPGVVLKIFFPNISLTVIDANNKKIKFLEELKTKLNIDYEIINKRVEDYAKDNLNKFMVVTSRAVANLRVLSELSLPLVMVGGYFIPLKGKVDNELKDAIGTISIFKAKIEKTINFTIPNAGERSILLIKKEGITNKEMLRSYDKILRNSLAKRK